jgi:tetrahydromethanopterin S-methyltransferase subunit B
MDALFGVIGRHHLEQEVLTEMKTQQERAEDLTAMVQELEQQLAQEPGGAAPNGGSSLRLSHHAEVEHVKQDLDVVQLERKNLEDRCQKLQAENDRLRQEMTRSHKENDALQGNNNNK